MHGARNRRRGRERSGASMTGHPAIPASPVFTNPEAFWTPSFSFWYFIEASLGFPDGSAAKNLPAVQEIQESLVWSLGWEDPLEGGMTTHSSILTWRIPWTEEPGRLRSTGLRVRHDWSDLAHTHTEASLHRHDWLTHQPLVIVSTSLLPGNQGPG